MLKLSSICRFLMVICASFMLGVPMLFPKEILGVYMQKGIILTLSLILIVLIFLLSGKNHELNKENKFVVLYLSLYLMAFLVVLFLSKQTLGYSWSQLVRGVLLDYLLPIAAIPIVYIFHSDGTIDKFLSLITKIVLVMLAIRFFSWFMYNWRGQVYFSRLLFQYEGWIRDGFQRIESGMLYGIALVVVTIKSLEKTTKGIWYKALLVFMVLFLVLVTRVRFQSFIALVTVFVIYCVNKSKSRHGFLIKLFTFILLFLVLVFDTSILQTLQKLISTQGTYGASTSVRFQGVDHYLSLMRDRNAYLGLGFLLQGNFTADFLMYRNQWSIYYLDDLGIVGTYVQMGLFVIITHGLLFWKAIQVSWKTLLKKESLNKLYAIGLTVYIISSCLLLNIFDRQRIFDVPFYLAIFSYLSAKLSKKEVQIDGA